MLFPKKVKHRRWQKARKRATKERVATRGVQVSFGDYGLQAMNTVRLRANQIEAARRVISRSSGKFSKIWIRVFPDRPVTRKAAEVPMGKGKGDLVGFEVEVFPGRVLFEIAGVSEQQARESLLKAGKKLPTKVRVIARR